MYIKECAQPSIDCRGKSGVGDSCYQIEVRLVRARIALYRVDASRENKVGTVPVQLLIVGHDLGHGLVRFKLCAHFLNLRCLLFHCRGESLHSGF